MLHVQDSPYIKTIHYETADDFIKAISYKGELYNLFDEHYIFRGHSTDKYELIPTALRGNLTIDSITDIEFASEEKLKQYDNQFTEKWRFDALNNAANRMLSSCYEELTKN